MSDTNVFGEAVFATIAERDACVQALTDFIQASQGTTEYQSQQGYDAGIVIGNNMHVGDSTGPGLRFSYRITEAELTDWSTSSSAALATALDMNFGTSSIP